MGARLTPLSPRSAGGRQAQTQRPARIAQINTEECGALTRDAIRARLSGLGGPPGARWSGAERDDMGSRLPGPRVTQSRQRQIASLGQGATLAALSQGLPRGGTSREERCLPALCTALWAIPLCEVSSQSVKARATPTPPPTPPTQRLFQLRYGTRRPSLRTRGGRL
ncbi:hypothetical protein AAFF_G00258430 [Aldrovandia affinis]|uniref:Uncharacterized protein n=1 Tax=Aldrovandia affinis TaxID=143900 RepID=A0AAD7ST83_9TELE|nr:hypothetical protein AAFF_G00258430 [Aldrovandia affinis]